MAGTRFDQFAPLQATAYVGRVLFWGEQRFRELATLQGLLVGFEGPWTDVERVTSRHTIPLAKLAEFFRIRQ